MARYGYGYVPEKGYIAFVRDLAEGAWKDVSLKKYDTADELLPGALLLAAPRPVVWKLRATWSIAELRDALGVGASELLLGLDEDWDRLQRKLYHSTSAAAEDHVAAHREAAGRLTPALLLGNGTAQTKLGYDEEVDFGRQQVELTQKGQLADDVKLLGLGDLLDQIAKATDALAKGLGRGPGQKRAASRSVRVREALAACTTAFNGIHEDIAWLIEHSAPDDTHKQLAQLDAPFQALLDRYPAPAAAKDTSTTGTTPASPATPAPATPAPAKP